MGDVFLGFGSNVGTREVHLESALDLLKENSEIVVVAESAIIETQPVGDIEQGLFLNQVLKIETSLLPEALLLVCLEIETQQGRIRNEKWGPRTLDIDILFYGNHVHWTPTLIIPHPEVHRRLFMLKPLFELAPSYVHPVFNQSVDVMFHSL